jgi:hypothetical protein
MNQTLIKQSFDIIYKEPDNDYRLVQAKKLILEIERQGSLFDWLKNPMVI